MTPMTPMALVSRTPAQGPSQRRLPQARAAGAARVTLLALAALLALLPGCRLEDRNAEAEGGTLPSLEVGDPSPNDPAGRPLGEDAAPPPVIELAPPFWQGADAPTRAVELNVRFVSLEARAAFLDPQAPVATAEGGPWTLERILVEVVEPSGDPRQGQSSAQAPTARWRIAGPPEVVAAYLAGLQDHPADRSPIVSMGILELEARPAPGG